MKVKLKVMRLIAPSSLIPHHEVSACSVPPIRHERPSAAGTRFATRQYIICSSPATLLLLSFLSFTDTKRRALSHNPLYPACNGTFLNGGLSTYKCELTFATFGEDRLHNYSLVFSLHHLGGYGGPPPFFFRGRWLNYSCEFNFSPRIPARC